MTTVTCEQDLLRVPSPLAEGDHDGCLEIDVGVNRLSSLELNRMMKAARHQGVHTFHLRNVCGQRYIATGIPAPAEIHVHGLSGNNAFALVDGLRSFTHPTRFPNGVHCPGNAQVAVANTANPLEVNIAGEVNDLFGSYGISGKFRVAKGGGVRNLLLFKAGVPPVYRQLDHERFATMSSEEVREDLLRRYQERRAQARAMGWDAYLARLETELSQRIPPVGIFGLDVHKGMGDYFMEYAQGGIGILLNIFDLPHPVGFYCCSGMSAGRAYIRGEIDQRRLGVGVTLETTLTAEDEQFLMREIREFVTVFSGALDDDYNSRLHQFAQRLERDPGGLLSEFCKVVPLPPAPGARWGD